MTRGALTLNRAQLLRALPRHALLALVSGAIAGVVLYLLKDITLEGKWNLLMFIPTAAVAVNAAMLPVIIPGRHWSFGFIGAVMLFLLLVIAFIVAPKLPLPHSRNSFGVILPKVNLFSYAAVLTGGCLGLFYGLLAGKRSAMIVGMLMAAVIGHAVGIGMLHLVSGMMVPVGSTLATEIWRFDGLIHAAWQCAAVLTILHIGACGGAAMGAGASNTATP